MPYTVDESELMPMEAKNSGVAEEEDSFAACYKRALAKAHAQLRSTAAVQYPAGSGVKAETAYNDYFDQVRKHVCLALHEYMCAHMGKVKRWADPADQTDPSVYALPVGDGQGPFLFHYFGGDYGPGGRRDKRLTFRNAYVYDKAAPTNEQTKALDEECEKLYGDHAKQAERELAAAELALKKAGKAVKKKGPAFIQLPIVLLVAAILVLGCFMPLLQLFAPAAVHESAKAALAGLGTRTDAMRYLMYIPIGIYYGVTYAIYVLNEIAVWLHESYTIGFAAWCLVAALFAGLALWFAWLDLRRIFGASGKARRRRCEKAVQDAQAARDKAVMEREELKRQFFASERYQKAKAQEEAERQLYDRDKAEMESYAEQWQRAWFDYLQKNGVTSVD